MCVCVCVCVCVCEEGAVVLTCVLWSVKLEVREREEERKKGRENKTGIRKRVLIAPGTASLIMHHAPKTRE